MPFPRARLHPPVLTSPGQRAETEQRLLAARAAAPHPYDLRVGPQESYEISLSTVSRKNLFDALIYIRLDGAEKEVGLVVDTGNDCLVLPCGTPVPEAGYVLEEKDDREPFSWSQADRYRGAIHIGAVGGGVFTIDDCVFWVCTDPDHSNANFGAGCHVAWRQTQSGADILPPLACAPDYPFAEFAYASAEAVLSSTSDVKLNGDSILRLSSQPPAGYALFDILKDAYWMALRPKSLRIGGTLTEWPSNEDTPPIAMIDTGGGAMFLSDRSGALAQIVPGQAAENPDWTLEDGSASCRSMSDPITLELGTDGSQETFAYTLDTSGLPAAVRGLTLTDCRVAKYMYGSAGLNIGGVSALVLSILVDYASRRVGLKTR